MQPGSKVLSSLNVTSSTPLRGSLQVHVPVSCDCHVTVM